MPVNGSQTLRPGAQPALRLVDLVAYDATGTGHVAAGRHETRHPCGATIRAERHRWPATTPCPDCVGWTETELRAAHGDR